MQKMSNLLKGKQLVLSNGKCITKKRSMVPLILVIVLAFTYLSVVITGFDLGLLMRRWKEFFILLGQMFPPDLNYAAKVWGPLIATIQMSFLGTLVGAVLAIPFAIIAASNIMKSRILVGLTRLLISILRAIPTLVTALIATYIFGLGSFAGTVSICIFTFAYVGKIMYEQIETVFMGPFEAMESMGNGKLYAFIKAVVPQVLPIYLSTTLFCFEGNVRYAAILGYVGAGGIGLILNEKIGWREYECVGMILLMLYITVFIIESISRALRKRLT